MYVLRAVPRGRPGIRHLGATSAAHRAPSPAGGSSPGSTASADVPGAAAGRPSFGVDPRRAWRA